MRDMNAGGWLRKCDELVAKVLIFEVDLLEGDANQSMFCLLSATGYTFNWSKFIWSLSTFFTISFQFIKNDQDSIRDCSWDILNHFIAQKIYTPQNSYPPALDYHNTKIAKKKTKDLTMVPMIYMIVICSASLKVQNMIQLVSSKQIFTKNDLIKTTTHLKISNGSIVKGDSCNKNVAENDI